MTRYSLRAPHVHPEAVRFIPESIREAGRYGLRPSFRKLLAHVDMERPEWPSVAVVLSEMQAAGIELCEDTLGVAQKMGAHRWATRERSRPKTPPGSTGTEVSPGAIVYYIRRGLLVKIGTTEFPIGRFADLLPDEVCAFEPGSYTREQQRHSEFRHLRCYREYFRMDDDLVAHIKALRRLHGDPDPAWPTWGRAVASASVTEDAADEDDANGESEASEHEATAELITASEAERRYGIKRGNLRVLVHRGVITPAGKEGQADLFFASEISERMAN